MANLKGFPTVTDILNPTPTRDASRRRPAAVLGSWLRLLAHAAASRPPSSPTAGLSTPCLLLPVCMGRGRLRAGCLEGVRGGPLLHPGLPRPPATWSPETVGMGGGVARSFSSPAARRAAGRRVRHQTPHVSRVLHTQLYVTSN